MRIETGLPTIIHDSNTESTQLTRVNPADHSVIEDWIQNAVFENPKLLPIVDIDPSFAPLLPIGREIGTSTGPVDALYISPNGALTIVEAKLWRNPQARREVVAQIIDYATAIAQWTYEDLDRTTRASTGHDLWELVQTSSHCLYDDEGAFVDAVSRMLREGQFLLLVVGDGIREEVERMAAYVQIAPQLKFSLALVELKIYDLPEERSRLIVPSIVARTTEVTRAVVEVDVRGGGDVQVDVSVPADDLPVGRRTLTENQFLEQLSEVASTDEADFATSILREYTNSDRFLVHWAGASFVVKLRNPTGGTPITILVFTVQGRVYPGWLNQQLPRIGIDPQLGQTFVADLAAIAGAKLHPRYSDSWASAVPIDTIQENYSSVRSLIAQLADDIEQSAAAE